jgi:hypothetical protein
MVLYELDRSCPFKKKPDKNNTNKVLNFIIIKQINQRLQTLNLTNLGRKCTKIIKKIVNKSNLFHPKTSNLTAIKRQACFDKTD